MLVALFFFVVIKACHLAGLPLLETLDRWGQDAAMRIYATRTPGHGPKVVLVNLDASDNKTAGISNIAELLDEIRPLRPGAVVVDATVDPRASPERVELLVKALTNPDWHAKDHGTLLAIPVENAALAQGLVGTDWVRAAAPDLETDSDGIVRQVGDAACTSGVAGHGRGLRPTLAQAAMTTVAEPSYGCAGHEGQSTTILFGRERNRPEDAGRGVLLLPEQAVASHPEAFHDAYVIIGHIGPGTDAFITPLGLMSGARIHAAAVWTLAQHRVEANGESRLVVFLLEVGMSLTLGMASATYTSLFGHEPEERHLGQKKAREVFPSLVLEGIGGLLLIAACVQLMVLAWTRVAAGMLEAGAFVGTVVPAFGALLEAFAHAGRHIVDVAEWIADHLFHVAGRVLRRRPRSTFLLALASGLLLATPCMAAEASNPCSSRLLKVQGDLDSVRIEPGSRRVLTLDPPMNLEQDDTVVLTRLGTTAIVEQDFWGDLKKTEIRGPDAMLLLPCPPNRESWTGWWEAFWGAANLHAATPPRPGTTPARSIGDLRYPYLSGKLRDLSTLAPAYRVVSGARGFAFAWAGGSPPFRVTLRDGTTGATLVSGTFKSSDAWWPTLDVPVGPTVVVVRDSESVELRHSIAAVPATAIPADSTAQALHLFQQFPADRLEALRRLHAESPADPLAQRALEAVRVAGGRE
jgi:hypothetical protein